MPALTRLVLACLTIAACTVRKTEAPLVNGGNADRGKVALRAYGCGTCHTIPGIRGARGLVGPSLAETGQRVYVAGVLPNEPENMVRWILDPPAVDPRTAMPKVGVSDQDARDMAEYIYQLVKR